MAKTNLFRTADNFETYAAGQMIFEEGQPGDFIYVVKEGEVEILVGADVVETLDVGEIFGEMALIEGKSVYKNSIPAVETAATSSQNRPSPVQTALRNGSQSAKADFVLLLTRFQSPGLLFIHSLRSAVRGRAPRPPARWCRWTNSASRFWCSKRRTLPCP